MENEMGKKVSSYKIDKALAITATNFEGCIVLEG